MSDTLIWRPPPQDGATEAALARASAAIARLDQVLASHPLLPAVLYCARLEAVRRAAVTDGQAIDPWHLAAVLEGLRLNGALRIIDCQSARNRGPRSASKRDPARGVLCSADRSRFFVPA